jgi:hypothetical protein
MFMATAAASDQNVSQPEMQGFVEKTCFSILAKKAKVIFTLRFLVDRNISPVHCAFSVPRHEATIEKQSN